MTKKSFLVFTAFMAAVTLNLSGCERMVQSAVVEPKNQGGEKTQRRILVRRGRLQTVRELRK